MMMLTVRSTARRAALFLRCGNVAGVAKMLAKAEQLGLFGKPREEVKNPGSRGGTFYRIYSEKVAHGDKPAARRSRKGW